MFGNPLAFTVPDLDRTDHLVVIGANPLVSNGSLATAADFGGKLKALRKRGGRLTVIDPTRTRTAELADRHLAPRPGTDAALLFAVVHVLFDEGLVAPDLGGVAEHVNGLDEVRALATEFPPEAVAAHCGVAAEEIRAVAREIAAAPVRRGIRPNRHVHSRIRHLGSWLVDVINILTGNLDRPGGAMFPLVAGGVRPAPAEARPGLSHRALAQPGLRATPRRCPNCPPPHCAEEIETPGEGQVKAVITIAGNPVLSAPDGDRLSRALDGIGFMLSVDPYLNETTRHADVILPPPPPSQSAHFDFALNNLSVRNNARYSPPVLPLADGRPDEPEILSRLALILYGVGPDADPGPRRRAGHRDDAGQGDRRSGLAGRGARGRRADRHAAPGPGYERRLDMMLRLGPYGDAFGAKPDGLTLERLKNAPHGIDFGPLQPRLPEVLRTRSGKVELAPDALVSDAARLRDSLHRGADGFVLIGRRHLRSNNSWMHNVPALAGGTNRCTLQIHPDDAAELGLTDTRASRVPAANWLRRSRSPTAIRRGVVSLPHGWGHDRGGTRLGVAAGQPGVNVNQLNDGGLLDPLSGTAVLNGIPVHIEPAH